MPIQKYWSLCFGKDVRRLNEEERQSLVLCPARETSKLPFVLLVMIVFYCVSSDAAVLIGENEQAATTVDRPPPKVLVNGELKVIEESTFPTRLHCGRGRGSSSSMTVNEQQQQSSAGSTSTQCFVLNETMPSLVYATNVLNESIMDELLSICESRFQPSPIRRGTSETSILQNSNNNNDDGGDNDDATNIRTSESCAFVPTVAYRQNPKLQTLRDSGQYPEIFREVDVTWEVSNIASQLVLFNPNHDDDESSTATTISPWSVEPLQMVRYASPKAHYQVHHDHGGFYGKTETEQRPFTVLIFLTTASSGGHTSFPKLGLQVVPRRGDALIWANTKTVVMEDEGRQQRVLADPDMIHAGMPPSTEDGTKVALNVWFGTYEDEMGGVNLKGGEWGTAGAAKTSIDSSSDEL